MNQTPLERAIAEAGSGVALAKIIGVTPMAVSYWKIRGVPAHQVLIIESSTGVSRHDLRPDIYPQVLPTMEQMMLQKTTVYQSDDPAVIPSSTKLDPAEALIL